MGFEKPIPEWFAAGSEPPASLKQSGFTAGYKPPADFFNWFWHSVCQCLEELQGMSPSDIGAQKDLFLGTEIISGATDDTFTKWHNLGTGYAFYSRMGLLNGQPSQYGFLLNIAKQSNVVQLWFALPNGTIHYRGGNSNGLATTWVKVLSSGNIGDTLLNSLGGVLSVEKGGTGKTNAADGFTAMARRETVGNSNPVNADTLTVPGIHQVYFEGSSYNPADYNFPYAYGVLFVVSTFSYVGQLFYAVSANKLWYRTRGTTSSPWGSWCKVYDTNNKPTLDELGAAEASKHNIKTYTNLSQLGLSNGATLSQVARALPGSSRLMIYVLTSENQNLAPTATNGWLEANRPATNHVEFRYTTTSRMVYNAVVLNVNNASEQVSEWTKIATESDIADLAKEKEDSTYPGCYYRTVNGVKEWLNPPLVAGTEYATTERYKGKVVYTRLVEVASLPNTLSNLISSSVNAISGCEIIEYKGVAIEKSSQEKHHFPVISDKGAVMAYLHVMHTTTESREYDAPWIRALVDMSGYSGAFTIKYIKNT